MSHLYTLAAIAHYLDGTLAGDPTLEISGIAPLNTAENHQIAFVANKSYEAWISSSRAGAIILSNDSQVTHPQNVILVDDAYLAYAKLSGLFESRPVPTPGIAINAVVHPTAQLGDRVYIGPFCVIEENAVIGNDVQLLANVFVGARSSLGDQTVLFPHVTIYHDVQIGERVKIHSNTCIGSDGFGFAPSRDGWKKIHQLGGVILGNDVEIGANTAIDRGALEPTEVADGVIIDNQVHIAHNVKIGRNTAIAGCVGIAGSTHIGANCTMGGFVAINGHLTIADNVHLNGGTIVTKSISEPGHYSSGTPLQEVKTWRRNAVRFGQLDEWIERIKKLENSSHKN